MTNEGRVAGFVGPAGMLVSYGRGELYASPDTSSKNSLVLCKKSLALAFEPRLEIISAG